MKRLLTSITLVALCAGLLALAATSVTAQTKNQMKTQASPEDINKIQSIACHTTLNYSNGLTDQFKICITNHGNLFKLESPAGFEHLVNASDSGYGDGYVLCSTGTVHGFEAGLDEAGWGAPTINQPGGANTLPLTITRKTKDGKFQLKQTFDWVSTNREVIITMVLKNLSGASIAGVKLARYFDADLSNDSADDQFDANADSVWGRDKGTGIGHHALMLTALSPAQPHTPVVEKYSDWTASGVSQTAKTCTPTAQPLPAAPGDYVGRLTYTLGAIPAGTSKTVSMIYRRI